MRHRRQLGALLAAAVVAVALVPTVHHVLAGGPNNATLPDFTGSPPIVETMPKSWALQVVSGGVSGGNQVTFTFLYNGKPGDRAHAVNFAAFDAATLNSAVLMYTVATLPTALPVGPPGTQQCTAPSVPLRQYTQVDPYAQTITITMKNPQPAGTILVYCFTGQLVGFPLSAGSGYSMRYTEPSGSTDTPVYSVQAQSTTTTFSQVLDADGSDRTDTGLGGSRPVVYGTSYNLTLRGAASNHYSMTHRVYDASSQLGDSAQVTIVGTGQPVGTCSPGPDTFCAGSTGVATGTITVTSSNSHADYVLIFPVSSVDTVPSLISVTVGPADAAPPAAQPTSTPLPSGQTPAATPPFDASCPIGQGVAAAHGIGAHNVLDAAEQVLFPNANRACPALASQLSYVGANDGLGLSQGLDDCYSPYAFSGMDRSLTATEYNSVPPCDRGVNQFPILIEPIVVSYNLDAPGCSVGTLNLRSNVLSLIFTGQITTWKDPALTTADNRGLQNCNLPILVAHDVGNATLAFKDYLGKRTKGVWDAYKQPQLVDAWPNLAPVSCTANGSAAMALCVEGQPGMIGYGYYRTMVGAGLPMAALDDPSGTFQSKPLDANTGCTNAALANPTIPATTSLDWSNTSLTDMPLSYPICAFDYLVAAATCHRALGYSGLKAFLGAVYADQAELPRYGYAPLPTTVTTITAAGYGASTNPPGPPNPQPLTC